MRPSFDTSGSLPPAGDAAVCVSVDLSTYDQSCNTGSDCLWITAGTLCSDRCACGNAVVNAAELPHYEAEVAVLPTPRPECHCAAYRFPTCLNGRCQIPYPTPLFSMPEEPPFRR